MCHYYRNQEVILTPFPRNSETTFIFLSSAAYLRALLRAYTVHIRLLCLIYLKMWGKAMRFLKFFVSLP